MSARLMELGAARIERVAQASGTFFERHAEALASAAFAMSQRFAQGGRLFVHGSGAAASDAHHVSVEFLHPVIVGQRALPAVALDAEAARRLLILHRRADIALAIANDGGDAEFHALLATAREASLLSLAFTGGGAVARADHGFVVPDSDPTVVQEVEETACHVLHELVHLFLGRSA
jgi:D-sedoheptulose 7-phosphate isomerase